MGKVMKVFKTLINELFGTKREYKVEGLGIFTCKVCDWWRDKCCLLLDSMLSSCSAIGTQFCNSTCNSNNCLENGAEASPSIKTRVSTE